MACLFVLGSYLSVMVLWTRFRGNRVLSMTGVMLLAACCTAGIAAAELWIVQDEAAFQQEVKSRAANVIYARDRTWPFDGCSLVYQPGLGIHATD